ncbi:hypothetical protein [Actinomyces oricola]
MRGGPLLAALLVALSTAVVLLPARRDRPNAARPRTGAVRPAAVRPADLELDLLLTEVATVLRAGATAQRAWERCLGRLGIEQGAAPGPDGVPPALAALAVVHESWWPSRVAGRWRWRPPWGRAAQRRRVLAAAVPGAVAACRLTHVLGAPLAGVLEAVAAGVAEAGRAEDSRRTALSGPRSTARLLACLPPVGLVLGTAVGARPQEVLLDGGWGTMLAGVGVALMVAGHWGTARLVAAAQIGGERVDEALVLDLAAAAFHAGASIPDALKALGRALGEEDLAVVGRALLLGADWEEAWEAPATGAPPRRRLKECLRPGWEDGASPAPLLAGTAACLRAGRQARDDEAAERLAVRLVLPLGLCHLPAFVVLGIVPVVASVGLDLLSG